MNKKEAAEFLGLSEKLSARFKHIVIVVCVLLKIILNCAHFILFFSQDSKPLKIALLNKLHSFWEIPFLFV